MGIPLHSAQASAGVFDASGALEPRITADGKPSLSAARSPSRGGAAKAPGRASTDSIGWYLSTIGRVPLLTPAEEIELAHHVRQAKELQQLPAETLTSRQKRQIRMGQRARDRMKIGRAHV